MEVRGSVVSSIQNFVKEKHSEEYDKWISALSEDSQNIMKRISTSSWYPIDAGVLEPTKRMCDLLYKDHKKGAWESGRYSAQMGLTGIYKVFVVISTPAFLIKRAARILATFYTPTALEVVNSTDHSMVVHFTQLPTKSEYLEHRISGWMDRALEICGCKNLSLRITQSIAKGDKLLEVQISWD